MSRKRLAAVLGCGLLLLGVVVLALVGPIPQDPAYHRFADARPFLGISNFGNVVSNIPFLIVGAAGLWLVGRSRALRTGGASDGSALPDAAGRRRDTAALPV